MALRKQDFDDNEEQSNKTTKRPRITIDVSPQLRRRIRENNGQPFEDSTTLFITALAPVNVLRASHESSQQSLQKALHYGPA